MKATRAPTAQVSEMCSLPTMDAAHAAAFNSGSVGPTAFAIFFGNGTGAGGTWFIHRSHTLEHVEVAMVPFAEV